MTPSIAASAKRRFGRKTKPFVSRHFDGLILGSRRSTPI
jgi:hypothetical protein